MIWSYFWLSQSYGPLTIAVATAIWLKNSIVGLYCEVGHRLGLKEGITEISSLIEIIIACSIAMLFQKAWTCPSAFSFLLFSFFLSHCAHIQSLPLQIFHFIIFFLLQRINLPKGLNINACPLNWTPLYSFVHPTEIELFISVDLSSEARIFQLRFSPQEKNLQHEPLYISRQWLSAARKLQANGTLL